MHEINKRQRTLLCLLLKETEFLPASYYANILSISNRTLFNYIDYLNNILNESGVIVEKKPRKGIRLNKNTIKIEDILATYEKKAMRFDFYLSPLERQIKIASYLLVEGITVSYTLLSEEFLVSKSSISKDLEQIQIIVEGCDIQFISNNNGTVIKGKESEIQKAIKRYAYFIIEKSGKNNSFGHLFPNMLFHFLSEETVEKISVSLQINDNFNAEKFSDNHFQSLVLSFSIFIIRMKKNNHIEHSSNFIFENVEMSEVLKSVRKIIENIGLNNELIFYPDDLEYLNHQLIAHDYDYRLDDKNIRKRYGMITKKIIKEMSESIQIDLTSDKKLYKNIMHHLISMIHRYKLNISVNNPLLEEIKSKYPILFSTTWLVFSVLENELGINLTEDELAFMMLHFQAAIDRASSNKKILVVCPTGIGTSELIANRLKTVFSSKDIIEVVSLRALYQMDLRKIDFIVSSVQLENIEIPVIYVSPLLSKEDLKNISLTYLDIFYDGEKINEQPFVHLGEVLSSDLILLNKKVASKNECIEIITKELLKRKYVTEEFEESIWDREKLGVTDLSSGAAIPHPIPTTVRKSNLVIMTLDKPIRWNLRMVNVIFMICIAEKDIKNIKDVLSEIYRVVESKEKINNYILGKTKKEILKKLGGKE